MKQPILKMKLVSIIVPVYNSEKFLEKTILSILDQTYSNWELILVNDRSTDSSLSIIKKYQEEDDRIRTHNSKVNLGAALSRNKGIHLAEGNFIAFLDADDFWDKSKLTRQLDYMDKQNTAFSYTGYEFTNEEGKPNGNKVKVPTNVSHQYYLKNNIIWTSTVLIDVSKIHHSDILMPNLSYGEDATTWLNILSKYGPAGGINETLSYYRRTPRTLSSNKFKAIINKWSLYMKYTDLSLGMRSYYYLCSLANATRKRM